MLEQKMSELALLGAAWVLWLLVALGVICVLIAAERGVYLLLNSAPTGPFQMALHRFLGGGSSLDLEQQLKSMRGVEVRVLLAGLEAAKATPDAAVDAMNGTLLFEKMRLDRGLLVIGTVASNAPYIGLFGTVLGIIKAFHDLSLQSDESASAVMAGISEALVATAMGLVVAIPAVVLYNFMTQRVRSLTGRTESLGALMISRLRTELAEHGSAPTASLPTGH